jgi:hypothetical protein
MFLAFPFVELGYVNELCDGRWRYENYGLVARYPNAGASALHSRLVGEEVVHNDAMRLLCVCFRVQPFFLCEFISRALLTFSFEMVFLTHPCKRSFDEHQLA